MLLIVLVKIILTIKLKKITIQFRANLYQNLNKTDQEVEDLN